MRSFALTYREGCTRGDAERNSGLETPENVVRYNDISYGSHEMWNKMDIYRPSEINEKLPVLISVHGGAWVYGDKDAYQFYCMSLCRYGFAVVNFSYRLAPEYEFSAQLEDLNAVIKYVIDNGDYYGMDVQNICLVGDSAGAHIAALYSGICTNGECASHFDIQVPEGFVPKALGLNCGIYDMKRAKHIVLCLIKREVFQKKMNLDKVSPCTYITKKFPPTYIVTAEGDFLKKQPRYLMNKFEKFHVEYQYRKYGTKKEPLKHVFHCDIKQKTAELCNKEECEFLKKYLTGNEM